MTTRTFDALGFDPAPGDSVLTSSTASTARAIASALEEVQNVLNGDGNGEWHGKAAEAFRDSMREELTPRVDEAAESFGAAARALTTWAEALPGFQSRADALEREAQEAREQLSSAQGSLDSMSDPGAESDSDASEEDQADERRAAEGRVTDAEGALAGVISRAEGLQSEVNQLASTTASSLNTAAGVAPDEPGFWESVGNFFEGINDWFWEEFVPIFEELAPWIGLVLAIASCWIPGLGQIALGLAIAAIAIDVGQAIRGEGSWGDVVMGVVGLAGGMALGKVMSMSTKLQSMAFQLRITPPVVGPGGTLAAPLTAVIKFNPTMFNVGVFGWTAAKFLDLHGALPEPIRPPLIPVPGDDDE